jgi:hypothetical protein
MEKKMKLTLLELTQNILSAMDSDEVNSISDTAESRQVSQIVRTAYFNIISRANLPEHEQVFSLEASGSELTPVEMSRPENVSSIEWIKYNKAGEDETEFYDYVTVLPLKQFLDYVHSFDPDEDNVETMSIDDAVFYFKNDTAPTYCTILKDFYVVFDSYDNEVDTTLQSSKTLCFGRIVPTFTMSDSFTPDMDEEQFPLLLNEAKSLAFIEMKQTPHQLAMRDSVRQWNSLQRNKKLDGENSFDMLPNYGRK